MLHKSRTMTPALGAAFGVALLAMVGEEAAAQHDPQHELPATGVTTRPADQAYQMAMERMHRAMAIDLTGDPDADFARAMIPTTRAQSTWRAWSWNTAVTLRFEGWPRR